jgi:hypothetical protein
MKKKNKPVDPEFFIKAWQTTESIAEVALATGMQVASARVRAALYRKKGIPLKKFPRSTFTKLDITYLTKFAKKLASKSS